jgi:hypothetical protein
MDIKSGFACEKSMMIENESNRSPVRKWRWTMNPLAVLLFPSFSNLNIAHVPHRKRQLSKESSWTPVSETLACGTSFPFSSRAGEMAMRNFDPATVTFHPHWWQSPALSLRADHINSATIGTPLPNSPRWQEPSFPAARPGITQITIPSPSPL